MSKLPTEWFKNCPECNRILYYKSKINLELSIKNNTLCHSCNFKINGNFKNKEIHDQCVKTRLENNNYKQTDISKQKISESLKEKYDSGERKSWNKGKKWECDKLKGRFGDKNPNKDGFYKNWIKKYGKEEADEKLKEFKNKQRIISFNKKMKSGQGSWANYNEKACKIINEYAKKHDYNFQSALNGGEYCINELGYFLDGYDKEKNVVIEYYEKWHNKQIEKDNIRMNRIINKLKCKFIILKETEDGIEEYIINYTDSK